MDTEQKILLAALVFAIITLLLILWRVRQRKKVTIRLERDRTGLWRYHPETQFQKKVAYGTSMGDEKTKAKKSLKPIAVIIFGGDVRARQHKLLAELVDEIEVNKGDLSEVVVVITSPGGMVPQYGHAFAQMERLRRMDLSLTVCVDVVAASGGYLMSVPANKILAAPFALVGSVGVMAFVPNIRGLLERWQVTPRTFTAGKYKRTITLTDNATPEEVARFQGQLESIHRLFIDAVRRYRPEANLSEIETGEHWTAVESVEKKLGLVDDIMTSHEYLLQRNRDHDLVILSIRRSFWEEGLSIFGGSLADGISQRLRYVFGNQGLS